MEERLQKIIARAGIASRRAAEEMIVRGRVTVNGVVTSSLGIKADPEKDEIRVDGKLIAVETEKLYLALHKPRGYVTSLHDPEGRKIVTDLLAHLPERLFPVGRLDYDSEGLLLLTNDGEFAHRLEHPRFRLPKTYRVKVGGRVPASDLRRLAVGIALEDGSFRPTGVRLEKVNKESCWLVLTIHEGRNRLIRRGFAALGHPVERLVRIAVGELTLGNLKEGKFRHLTKREVEGMKALMAGKLKIARPAPGPRS
jgi:23S rRNA pseudouridine2605 synthase